MSVLASVVLYCRSAFRPEPPADDVTYFWGQNRVENAAGWCSYVPPGTFPIWTMVALVTFEQGKAVIRPAEWSDPVMLAAHEPEALTAAEKWADTLSVLAIIVLLIGVAALSHFYPGGCQ